SRDPKTQLHLAWCGRDGGVVAWLDPSHGRSDLEWRVTWPRCAHHLDRFVDRGFDEALHELLVHRRLVLPEGCASLLLFLREVDPLWLVADLETFVVDRHDREATCSRQRVWRGTRNDNPALPSAPH